MNRKVMVAMSGGVDSSVAALLLKNGGYDVTGVTMCFGVGSGGEGRCCGSDAVDDARKVCEKLKAPHYVFDFSRELESKVIHKFVDEYGRGRTPNPCIDCNRYLKFGSLLEKASVLGFDALATGHYARIEREEGKYYLKRPEEKAKDQTYFLYAIPSEALSRILFPLARLTKADVRSLARKAALPVAEKSESQDLCFVNKSCYSDFVSRRMSGVLPGPIVSSGGKMLGTHRGIAYYTIGQRSGLGVAHPVPLYVISIDVDGNRLIVGERAELKAKGLTAGDLNIFVEHWPDEVLAKIRYRRNAARCTVVFENGRIKALFQEEEEAVTPGQAAVFYHRDYVLGGGAIEEVVNAAC